MNRPLMLAVGVSCFGLGLLAATLLKQPVSVISLFSSFVVAVATYLLVDEARKTREVQTAPDVSVSLNQPTKSGAVYLLVRNNGAGTARNIRFDLDKEVLDFRSRKITETSYMKKGFNYLVPKQEVKIMVGTHRTLEHYIQNSDPFTISVEYQSDSGKTYRKEFPNDLSALSDTPMFDQPIESISTELKAIGKTLNAMKKDMN